MIELRLLDGMDFVQCVIGWFNGIATHDFLAVELLLHISIYSSSIEYNHVV